MSTKTLNQADTYGVKIVNDSEGSGDNRTGEVRVSVVDAVAATGSATSAKQDTQITAEQAIQATLGATTGTAVATDANGTIQQYLRGLIKLVAAKLSVYITGAANIAITQVTAASSSGVLVASRATRRTVTVRNQDAANSVYIGTGTVTSGNGFLLKFGESVSIDTVAALNCIRDTADVSLGVIEIYD